MKKTKNQVIALPHVKSNTKPLFVFDKAGLMFYYITVNALIPMQYIQESLIWNWQKSPFGGR